MKPTYLRSLFLAATLATMPTNADEYHPYPWAGSSDAGNERTDTLDHADAYARERFGVTTERVADGIYVMRRVPSWRTMVQANVTVIVNDHDVVVVDGGTSAYVDNVVAEIRKITDKPVSTVITTHWHGDHNRGNHVYREAWPDVTIIAHEKTYRNMVHWDATIGPYDEARKQRFIDNTQERLKKLQQEGQAASVVEMTQDQIAGADEIFATLQRNISGLADITFKDKLVLKRGNRDIEILFLGRANTDGDAIIWLPDEKVVFTGDTVVRPTPYGFYSYPREWAATLERVKALGADVIVPGHGRIMHDSGYLDTLIHLFRDLSDQADAAVKSGADSPEAVKAAIDFSKHEAAITGGDPLFMNLFDLWFKTPISDSAFKAAKGQPILQYEEEE